jgi:CubicO group peptidase (beta-lactamase class C family)
MRAAFFLARVLLAAGAPATAVAQEGAVEGVSARVDQLVERYRGGRKIPGLSVAVVRNGRVIKAKGYGSADLELGTPVTPAFRFGLGSISKQFTATAIMQLAEEGRLAVDDPVTKYVDSLPPHWGRITIRQLLTHTSGLPEERWLPNFVEFDRVEHEHLDVLRTIFQDSLQFTPGGGWAYRNSAYRLLGMVVERVSGESYWSFLERRIFQPLGMTSTRGSDPKTIIPHRSKGYGRERGRVVNRDAVAESAAFSEGALISTVLDLARWDSALYRPRVVSQQSLDQMWTPVTLNDGTTRPYGFGWALSPTNGLRTISHGGSLPGFTTAINRFVAKGLTVIVLTNAEWSEPSRVATAIAGLYEPELAPRAEAPIADPDPAFTSDMQRLLVTLARGELDQNRLSADEREEWPPEVVDEATRLLTRLGGVPRLELLARDVVGESVRRVYRVGLDRGNARLTVVTDKPGLLTQLDLQEALLEK